MLKFYYKHYSVEGVENERAFYSRIWQFDVMVE